MFITGIIVFALVVVFVQDDTVRGFVGTVFFVYSAWVSFAFFLNLSFARYERTRRHEMSVGQQTKDAIHYDYDDDDDDDRVTAGENDFMVELFDQKQN